MENVETLHVYKKKVKCDGGNANLGHPAIYLDMGMNNHIICPYCSKKFVYQDNEN